MPERARAMGINHVALTVGDVDEAVAFYRRFADFKLRGRAPGAAFLDLGDQFLALMEGDAQGDRQRHFGLVVDDKDAVLAALREGGVDVGPGGGLRFHDPWGNLVEIVDYRDVQFTKAPAVLRGMGLEGVAKSPRALKELAEKGLGEPAYPARSEASVRR